MNVLESLVTLISESVSRQGVPQITWSGILSVLLIAACGPESTQSAEMLVGDWELVGADQALVTFVDDGNLLVVDGGDCSSGNWRIVDVGRVYVKTSDRSDEAEIADFSLSGEVLTLVTDDDSVEFVRAEPGAAGKLKAVCNH